MLAKVFREASSVSGLVIQSSGLFSDGPSIVRSRVLRHVRFLCTHRAAQVFRGLQWQRMTTKGNILGSWPSCQGEIDLAIVALSRVQSDYDSKSGPCCDYEHRIPTRFVWGFVQTFVIGPSRR